VITRSGVARLALKLQEAARLPEPLRQSLSWKHGYMIMVSNSASTSVDSDT
jgi:hypothetical protein